MQEQCNRQAEPSQPHEYGRMLNDPCEFCGGDELVQDVDGHAHCVHCRERYDIPEQEGRSVSDTRRASIEARLDRIENADTKERAA